MTVVYVTPSKTAFSGGARKLADHVCLLNQAGIPSLLLHTDEVPGYHFASDDLAVVPEIYGDWLREGLPAGLRRVSLVQNPHLIWNNVRDPKLHPYLDTPDLVAVAGTDAGSMRAAFELIRGQTRPPLVRLHLSGNGRDGRLGPMTWGHWPRARRVVYFLHKYEDLHLQVAAGLQLPRGWSVGTVNGPDAEVARSLQTASILFSCSQREGWCGPTMEALACGALIACWPGGEGPLEYLEGRAQVVTQGDLEALTQAVSLLAHQVDAEPGLWARRSEEWSEWFARVYSRERETFELIEFIYSKL